MERPNTQKHNAEITPIGTNQIKSRAIYIQYLISGTGYKRTHQSFWDSPTENVILESNHEETLKKKNTTN